MQTIEQAALQAADPLAVKTMAQRAEHLADVVTYIEENYPATVFTRIELSSYSGEEILLHGGAEIVRWLGPVTMKPHGDKYMSVETQFRGVRVFSLCESFVP